MYICTFKSSGFTASDPATIQKSIIVARNFQYYGAIDLKGRVVMPFVYNRIEFKGVSCETIVLVNGEERIYV